MKITRLIASIFMTKWQSVIRIPTPPCWIQVSQRMDKIEGWDRRRDVHFSRLCRAKEMGIFIFFFYFSLVKQWKNYSNDVIGLIAFI